MRRRVSKRSIKIEFERYKDDRFYNDDKLALQKTNDLKLYKDENQKHQQQHKKVGENLMLFFIHN